MTDHAHSQTSESSSYQEVDFTAETQFETASAPETEADPTRLESVMHQELESVDFYISQGYTDIAIDTLSVLEKQFGPHPDIQLRRERLNAGGQPASVAPSVFEFGEVEELPASHEETVTLDMDMSHASLGSDDGLVSASLAETTTSPSAKGIDSGLAELFEEFRVAEEEDTGQEDFETHYNMGTAYKEMELIDEAIQEFQTQSH